jgi:hypothetical protein
MIINACTNGVSMQHSKTFTQRGMVAYRQALTLKHHHLVIMQCFGYLFEVVIGDI